MSVVDGFTGAELVTAVAELLGPDPSKTDVQKQILRYIEYAQLKIFNFHDWPELIVSDCSFDTDGSDSYDLTDADNYIGATFGRIAHDTMRIGTKFLTEASRPAMVYNDPSYVSGGSVSHYCLLSRKKLFLYPIGASNGDTVKFDYVKIPTAITYDSTAAENSFEPWNHQLIIEGALWPGMRKYGKPDWMKQKMFFYQLLKEYKTRSKTIKRGSQFIKPISF